MEGGDNLDVKLSPLRFYDTAGLEGTKEVPRHLLQAADGFVIVYR